MITASYVYQIYHIVVHTPCVMTETDKPFVSMEKYDQNIPVAERTEAENKIADFAVAYSEAHPQTHPHVTWDVLPCHI